MRRKIKYPRYFVPLKYWNDIIKFVKFNNNYEFAKVFYIHSQTRYSSNAFSWTIEDLKKCVKEKSWKEVATKEELALVV